MSQIFKAILATLAVSGTFGAVQLASGHDLIGGSQLASTEPAGEINRTAKADRVALKVAQTPTETITIRSVGLPDTSVVVRVPVAQMPGTKAPKAGEEVRNRPEPSQARCHETSDRLRTPRQRFDRGRQAARTRPLRDLIEAGFPSFSKLSSARCHRRDLIGRSSTMRLLD